MIEDDDSMAAFWNDVNKARQEKRAANRDASPRLLTEAGIVFESKNFGAHLIVGPARAWDFWPGTGRWSSRSAPAVTGFGVRNLINRIKKT